ncbi:peptide/nickel transport system permease protein [Actinoplanes campanulatus]|uniref:Peptide/nickel transport system permease protein n=1 Tax=Actinoplanes campanulatus TaxID=113559 RepID=A0A7W5FFP1_9ACTN|nr:ABC transporter permease [Actinoplanes campanulatus]MBB3096686.1 peptide/nickel transport system permease protein [Actinoplanes campanulatus]GGN30638.1 ABC transporter permease [Actinoplanes campanulatus]GID37229.1 ABC transporter permease [Actinoplanes campanulatus]
MIRAIARRAGSGLVVLWAAATAAYLALLAAPGDTVDSIIGDGADRPQIRAQIIAEWNLDRPAVVQYLDYLWRAAQGDLGRSYLLQRPVRDVIGDQLAPTLKLAVAAAVFGVVLALILAVVTRGRWARRASSTAELVLVSTPPFLIGIVLLSVFSFRFGMFPVSGDRGWAALVLPAVTLGLPIAGVLAQVLRDGLDRALDEPFAVTARARGLTERSVLLRHGLRHSLLPAVTLLGWLSGVLIGGSVIIEQVFGRPGLGQVTLQAVSSSDMPVVLAVVVLAAAFFVVINTAADLAYLLIDPRLRRS